MLNFKTFILLILLIAIGFSSRIGWFFPNWALLGALALWGPFILKSFPLTLVMLLTVLFASDWRLGFYPEQIWVYTAYLPYAFIGILGPRFNLMKPIGGSIGFFVISNFGVWMSTPFYTKNFEGLYNCYLMALPFFRTSLLSDLFYYSVIGLGVYYIRHISYFSNVRTANFKR